MNYLDRLYAWRSWQVLKQIPKGIALDAPSILGQLDHLLVDAPNLVLCDSQMANAGLGVYIQGFAPKGTLLTLYPGTVYRPDEPIFWVSIRNHYILRCFDGLCVDAKPFGLSKHVFSSLAKRIDFDPRFPVTTQWFRQQHQWAWGHLINHSSQANAAYYEMDVDYRPDFPFPNLHYSSQWNPWDHRRRIVGIVTTRDVQDEELYTTYHEVLQVT